MSQRHNGVFKDPEVLLGGHFDGILTYPLHVVVQGVAVQAAWGTHLILCQTGLVHFGIAGMNM